MLVQLFDVWAHMRGHTRVLAQKHTHLWVKTCVRREKRQVILFMESNEEPSLYCISFRSHGASQIYWLLEGISM